MKIKKKGVYSKFENFVAGATFQHQGGFYMKVHCSKPNLNLNNFNGVNIETGNLVTFELDTMVLPVHGSFIED